MYSQAALAIRNAAVQCKQLVAKHKILLKNYNGYLGAKEAGKELILYAVGDDALAPLKKKYIGFGHSTILVMISYLRLKTAIKMMMAQKHEFKTTGYNLTWDPTTSITVYFIQLGHFQVSLGNRGITMSNTKKTMGVGAQMWQSKIVRMSDCCLQGIQSCKWKGKGHQWVGNQVFRLGLRKESIKQIKSEISAGDLRNPFREFKNRKFLLVSKC